MRIGSDKGYSVALGTFDGIHLGHLPVLRGALERKSAQSMVVTFRSPPKKFLGGSDIPLLMTPECKIEALKALGFDDCLVLDFADVRNIAPVEFLEGLLSKYNITSFSCGYNYRYGKEGLGNEKTLREFCAGRQISVNVYDEVKINGVTVSSSKIRAYIEAGEVEKARSFLGRPFGFSGKVVKGNGVGRKLGFPTVNQCPLMGLVMPRFGVYATNSVIDGRRYASITNVGIRPTFMSNAPVYETNIFGFDGDV
ncbi:MAG: riboflavin kinase, partial [bacterium]|nr:riboflavin kinase [bacterium]